MKLDKKKEKGVPQPPVANDDNDKAIVNPHANDDDDNLVEYIPEPRTPTTIKFTYSPRLFPTPKRESKIQEEGDWLAKNRRFLKHHAKFAKHLEDSHGLEENDPTWLKSKGDDFFKSGDYKGAINAYSAALELDPALHAAVANRSACHLKLRDYESCIDDCTFGLHILPVANPTMITGPNYKEEIFKLNKIRVKFYLRRATALSSAVPGSHEKATPEVAKKLKPVEPPTKAAVATNAEEKSRSSNVAAPEEKGHHRPEEEASTLPKTLQEAFERALADFEAARDLDGESAEIMQGLTRMKILCSCASLKSQADTELHKVQRISFL